jgi:hypothetical protein
LRYSLTWDRTGRNFLRKNSQTFALPIQEDEVEQTFTASEAQQWLAQNLPTWRVRNGYLLRVYKTGSWRLTLMVANAIGY